MEARVSGPAGEDPCPEAFMSVKVSCVVFSSVLILKRYLLFIWDSHLIGCLGSHLHPYPRSQPLMALSTGPLSSEGAAMSPLL